MQESNQNLWAKIPGDSGMVIYRNFTFFNFTNPLDFVFYNKTPEFMVDGLHTYQEYQEFTDREYLDDGDQVAYNYWQYFKTLG